MTKAAFLSDPWHGLQAPANADTQSSGETLHSRLAEAAQIPGQQAGYCEGILAGLSLVSYPNGTTVQGMSINGDFNQEESALKISIHDSGNDIAFSLQFGSSHFQWKQKLKALCHILFLPLVL